MVNPSPTDGPPVGEIAIDFVSPVAFERRDAVAVDRDMLFGSILSRLAGVAAWHGLVLSGDWPTLAEEAGAAGIDGDHLRPIAWERRSFRQHGRTIVMKGLVGRIGVSGRFDHWAAPARPRPCRPSRQPYHARNGRLSGGISAFVR